MMPAVSGAVAPFLIVQARDFFEPAVRNICSPSAPKPGINSRLSSAPRAR